MMWFTSRRRPAVEEWDRNKGTRTSLADGKQHSVKTVGIGMALIPPPTFIAVDKEELNVHHTRRHQVT
jgi:hypothetical protein